MTERVVKVSLLLLAQQYIAEQAKVAQKTRESASEVDKLGQKTALIEGVGRSALVMGAAVGVGVGAAIVKYAEFDAQMSSVQAATHANVETQNALRDAAIEAGATTVFTATDSARAIEELAKAGISAKDTLGGGLSGALALASAGQLDVGQAAEIAATALTQFNLKGADVPHVADLLAAGAGKAQGSVEDLSQALNQGGLVASQTGLTIEETTGTLAAFASAGLLGSDAGTSFKTMLQRLTPQSAEARGEMERLGISAYDAQGNFIGMEKFAGVLRNGLSGLTNEQRQASLGIIFGSDAVRAASVIYNQGAEGVRSWIDQVNDSGFAAETARLKLDNLNGDVEKLGGSFDTALIKTGSTANDVLRGSVQTVTSLVDGYNQLPEPLQAATLGAGALTAAVALGGGTALLAVPKYAALLASLQAMGPQGQAAARGLQSVTGVLMGPWGAAMAVGVGAFVAWNAAQQQFLSNSRAIADTLDQQTGAITKSTREYAANELAAAGAFEAAKRVGIGQSELVDAVLRGGDAFDEVNDKLSAYSNQIGGGAFDAGFGNGLDKIRSLRRENEQSTAVWSDLKSATEDATAATDDAAATTERNTETLAALSGKAQDAKTDISALAESIRGFASGELDAREAARRLEEAVDAVSASVEKNGQTLDIGTAAGRENEAALDAIAQAAKNSAAANLERGGSEDEARAAVQRGRDELILALQQFDITGQAAEDYANRLGLIPSNINTAVTANTGPAESTINAFRSAYGYLRGTIEYRAVMPDLNGAVSGNGRMGTFADGGYTGPGGKHEVRGFVHADEFVSTKETTSNPLNRAALEYMHRGGVISGYAGGGYVRGSDVRYVQTSSTSYATDRSSQLVVHGGITVNNPRQLTARGSTVAGLRALEFELGMGG